MTIYDGSEFGAIDATAYSDGKPSDTWLRRKIENNIAFLTINEPPVTVLRKGGGSTPLDEEPSYFVDRAIASWATTVFICQPVWVGPTTTHIRMRLCIRSSKAYHTGTVSAVFIGASVRQNDGKIIGLLSAASFDDTRSYEQIGLTTYMIPVAPTGSGFVTVLMTMQSRLDDTNPSQKTQTTFASLGGGSVMNFNFSGSAGKYFPALSPSSLTLYPFDHGVVGNLDTDQHGDILAFDEVSADEGTNLYRLIVAGRPEPGIGGGMDALGVQPLSFLQMRSYTVEVVHRYNLREAELASGVPDRGIDNLRHAQSTRLLRGRPRLIAGGPEGYMPAFRDAIQGRHPQIWASAFGGPASSAQPITTILRAGAAEPFSGGKIQIMMLLHGCAHNAIGRGTVDWELVATARNWVGTPITSTTVYPIATVGTQGAWTQTNAGGLGTSWIPSIQRAASGLLSSILSTFYYAVRDGQFLPQEFTDLTPVVIELSAPASGSSIGYDIEVTAECSGNVIDLSLTADPFKFQHLTLVGYAIYLVPNEVA